METQGVTPLAILISSEPMENGLGASQFPTTLISNQWTRFAYVKNQKIFVNNTKTLKQAGNDNPYGKLIFWKCTLRCK